ncbi:MAG: sensor domain-containing diguanylate cyclase, partial [Oscillospiraceae bacterium]
MGSKAIRGIIGITDEGQPIVTADYQCPHFMTQAARLTGVRECWYCEFSDFRKTCDITLKQSLCRCPKNRVKVIATGKNEQIQPPSPVSEKFVSDIKGGVITCLFNHQTQSSTAVYINPGWTAITGYTLEELHRKVGGNPQALVYPEDKPNADLEYNRQLERGNEYALLYRVVHKNGGTIWVIDRGVVSVLPNGDIQNQSIITEVTELKEQEERLLRLARLDQLTDLYNRAAFTQQANMILARQYDRLHAVMILDIDDFKKINDSVGHAGGDQVLVAVARCLKQLFRNDDVLSRIGGDEFMILMVNVPGPEAVRHKAQELCSAVQDIRIEADKPCPITVSVGI